jgi:ATP-binding cassette, subfamily B, bacterial
VNADRAITAPEQRGRRRTLTVDDVLGPAGTRELRRLPALIADAFRLVWVAAPRELIAAATLQALAGLSLAGQLLVTRRILDRLATYGLTTDLGPLVVEFAAFGALLLLVAVAALTYGERQRLLAEQVERYATGRVMDVATHVELVEYEHAAFSDQLQRARLNASSRAVQIANGVLGLVGGLAAVGSVGVVLLLIEPAVAGLLFVGAVPALALNRRASRVLHHHAVRQTAPDRRRLYLYELLTRRETAQEVRAFDSSAYLRQEHDRLHRAKIDDLRRTVRQRTWYGLLSAALATAVTLGSVALLLYLVRSNRTDVTEAVVAVGAVLLVGTRLRALVASGGSLYEGALFLRDFTSFVERTPAASATPAPGAAPAMVEPGRAPGFGPDVGEALPLQRLELDRVSFTYPSRDRPSLHEVSLTIERGEVIAVVGANGSGKTTLIRILAGLYRPTTGRYRWNRVDTEVLGSERIRDHVTVIFQDFLRYFLTAHENIAIGRPSQIDDVERVRHVSRLAGAEGFLDQLPSGYRSLLGPTFLGGSDLSIGQWQRVALARAYFRQAPLLILDEPTAALDPRGEEEIFRQVRRLAADRTVVLVTHRFSNVRAADRILVLDEGHLVEQGSHEELASRGGLYAELYHLQARGYERETT